MLLLPACSQKKHTNWNMTFDRNSMDPYGCYLAYNLLDRVFPYVPFESGRNIFTEAEEALRYPLHPDQKQRLSVVVCREFSTDSLELDRLVRYVRQGNFVCILAENFSENMFRYFHASCNRIPQLPRSNPVNGVDTVPGQALHIFFNHRVNTFRYDGPPVTHAFTPAKPLSDSLYYMIHAGDAETPCNLIRFEGDGIFMICRNPVTMTNHFLLHQNNKAYYEYFFSYFPESPSRVTWYSSYLNVHEEHNGFPLAWILKNPPLTYALVLTAILLLLFTLFESKRRQRSIAELPPNRNSSVDFVQTVARLYYNKKDHTNLAGKLIRHYLEHVRSHYNLHTHVLDESFARDLAEMTGKPLAETDAFVLYLQYIRDSARVSATELRRLYLQLKKFR